MKRLLCLCDSPTMQTGFARVARNLITRWGKSGFFDEIWVWGVGYNGFPHRIECLSNRICPASTYAHQEWYHPTNLNRFLAMLDSEGDSEFTHLWMMQDTFLLYPLAKELRKICDARGIRSLLYFPVDAPLESTWTDIIAAVDLPVAYCEYGRQEARAALAAPVNDKSVAKQRAAAIERLRSIPHGVDTEIYRPERQLREQNRKLLFNDIVKPDDFLIINVSAHQKRKGLAQSLEVVAKLKDGFPHRRWRLFMHMPSQNKNENTDLRAVARQLGLKSGEDLFYSDSSFENGHALLHEKQLNGIYNAADLLLTTSHGEGWGLPITEAMAAGLPVAGPDHTSVSELLDDRRGILFKTVGHTVLPFDNSRLRPITDTDGAALGIGAAANTVAMGTYSEKGLAWAKSDFLNWDRIAAEWLECFAGSNVP